MPPRRRRPEPTGDEGAGADRPDDGGPETPRLGRNPDADPVQIHRDYVERRIGGGSPPTSEAYARAIEQFSRIPGATRTPSTGMTAESIERRVARADVVPQEEMAAEDEAAVIDEVVDEELAERAVPDDDTGGVWEPGR